LLEKALQIDERHYGSDRPEVANTLRLIGNVYGALWDAEKQREFLERALKTEEKHYGSDHPQVAITLIYLGNVYGVLGNVQK
jgi:hypothetical protein